MPGTAPKQCPVCGAEIRSVGASSEQIRQESDLRASFVTQRLGHRPDELELMDLTRFMHGGPGRLLSCRICGLLFREEDGPAHYEVDVYDPELMKHMYPRYLRAFAEKTQYRPILRDNAEVLEVGSHLGAFLEVAEQWGWRPTGLDIGVATSQFARRKGATVKRLPMEDYSPRCRPDAVFIWNCFEQLEDPSAALRETHRLLAPQGLLTVRVPNAGFYRYALEQLKNEHRGRQLRLLGYNNLLAFPYLYGYTPSLLTRFLRVNGFTPIASHPSSLLTPPYPDLSRKIKSEWREVRRDGETAPVGSSPWIEIVSRRTES